VNQEVNQTTLDDFPLLKKSEGHNDPKKNVERKEKREQYVVERS
jgi:hypothetical protein